MAGVSAGPGEGLSSGLSALLTEGHASQFFLKTLLIPRVARTRETFGHLEEAFLFPLSGLKAGLDQLDDDPVDTRPIRFCQRLDPTGDSSGKAYALANRLFVGWHHT